MYTDFTYSPKMTCAYESFLVTNNDAMAYDDLWVSSEFAAASTIKLHTKETTGTGTSTTAYRHLGPLAAGATKSVFFYLEAASTSSTGTSHVARVYNAYPGVGTQLATTGTVALAVDDFGNTGNSHITSITVTTPNNSVVGNTTPAIGGTVKMTVVGDVSNIGSAAQVILSPATTTTWRPDAFILTQTKVTFTSGNSGTRTDEIAFTVANSVATDYTAEYTFLVAGPTLDTSNTAVSTSVLPTTFMSSGGTGVKHTGSYPATIPPVQPPVNYMTLVATPTQVVHSSAGGSTAYTFTITNAGTEPATIDRFLLTYSGGSTISAVASSSTFNGVATTNPVVTSSSVTWGGLFSVPSGASRSLVGTLSYPAQTATYAQSAVGMVGATQIDETTSMLDDSPIASTVYVGTFLDHDGDGVHDSIDQDDDNDGIADSVELGGQDLSGDTDSDGIPDYKDKSLVTACVDTTPANGICDALHVSVDADGDGTPNHFDLDADGDGLTDVRESGGTDANGDGSPDDCSSVNATTGVCTSGLVAAPTNTDSPADASYDFLDLDSDNDGVSDHIEAFDGANNDGVSSKLPSGTDTDADGIDNSFDPGCVAAACGGTLGAPVLGTLTADQDSDGNGVPDWLQVCGDNYLAGSEACDDGNGVTGDACSNTCKRGVSVSCTTSTQCNSTLCDSGLGTCQVCVDSSAGGTDSGCSGASFTCATVSSTNSCVICADTQAGLVTDDGCGGSAKLCNTAGNAGLGSCVECLGDADCDDGNECTTDSCGSGVCSHTSATAGMACTGSGVCNGAASNPVCVTCVNNAATGVVDAGCSAGAPACDISGASPVCVTCLADGDCSAGVCSSKSCVSCEDNQPGAATDHGCTAGAPLCNPAGNGGLGACISCTDDQTGDATDTGCGGSTPICNPSTNTCVTCLDAAGNDDLGCTGATAMCNTSGNGGLGVCAACLGDADCNDSNQCTTDTCNSGVCSNASRTAGTACTGSGVCDGASSNPVCITCVNDAAVGATDSGCSSGAPSCDTSGASPVCVACVADGDCTSGVCGASKTCVTCENNASGASTDHGCSGSATLCDATGNAGAGACISCTDDQTGDATDTGCGGSTPICNPSTNTCVTCLDAAGNDDLGCTGATAMCNTSGNGGLGVCAACLGDADCNDSNQCTTDTCNSGVCSNASRTAGTACTGSGVCDGASSNPVCITCVNDAAVGATDSGCSSGAPSCDTSGASPVCVACVADGDCTSGVCGASKTCVTCENNASGASTDHGCSGSATLCDATGNAGAGACVTCFDDQTGDATDSGCGGSTPICNPSTNTCVTCLDAAGNDDLGCTGATAMCNTSGNGGLGVCAACLGDSDCNDSNQCTTDTCNSGVCSNASRTAGTACTGSGVCDGASSNPACITCVNDATVGATDSGCSSGAPACDTSGASPVCVACVADGDCTSGVCGASKTCVTCENNASGASTDHGCSGSATLCDATGNGGLGTCISCTDDQTGDATDTGCGGSTPICNPSTNTCVTCLDAAGNDDLGCTGATAMCNTSGNGGLGVCAACLGDADCNDSNQCTTDTCNSGVCSNASRTAGTACTGSGVCDGASSNPACITCVNDAAVGATDSGCSSGAPACDTSGASPVCVACVADGDCTSGVCGASKTCVTCENNASGASTDHGCSGSATLCDATGNGGAGACVTCFDDQTGDATDSGCGSSTPICNPSTNTCVTCLDAAGNDDLGCTGTTAMCNTSGNGGLGVCAGCLGDSDCNDGNECTTDKCGSGGTCSNTSLSAGVACSGGKVCNGAGSNPSCSTCIDDAAAGLADSGCASSGLSICDTAGSSPACVQCVIADDCLGDEVCLPNHTCSAPDHDGDGVSDQVDGDDDNDGIGDDVELGGQDLSVDSDSDGIPDYRDKDVVSCTDTTPADGACDELPAAVDTDGDGLPNHFDRDADDDGLTDVREAGGTDDDGDGIVDGCSPVDTDGVCSGGLVSAPVNTDGPADALPDFLDTDSDGDGVSDHDEAFDSDGNGTANLALAGVDTNRDGIDDAFDAACALAADCAGVIGAPLSSTPTVAQDADGNGKADWLQVCGDAYLASGEACDDGNGVDGDACSNSCLRAVGQTCTGAGQCGSTLCDTALGKCESCLDDKTSGSDSGCSGATPTCATVSGVNVCVVCHDDQTGLTADDGCSGSTGLCDATAAGGAGACVACIANSDCSDSNECTTDTCSSGSCGHASVAVGGSCNSGAGVCDGTLAAACVTCVDDAAAGATDHGCSSAAPLCQTSSSGAPKCVECLTTSDCAGGQCTANTCVPGCSSDSDCAGTAATPHCQVSTGQCHECNASSHCKGEKSCTSAFTCAFEDNDGEGLADDVDSDDDGDGILDRDELGGTDLSGDDDDDGIPDYKDDDFVSCKSSSGVCDQLPAKVDFDHDGIPNHLDLDSDDDGIADAIEGHDENLDGKADRAPVDEDTDGDGLDDAFDAQCSKPSSCGGVIGKPAPRPDTDGDKQPNFLDADDDGDGRSTSQERKDAKDYEGPAKQPSDIDGDGALNWYDTDADDDSALDVSENMGGGDVDDNGLLDYLDPLFRAPDMDHDGVLDVVECAPPAYPRHGDCDDSDGDGTPDYQDGDDDGDGVATSTELNPPRGMDVDGDGHPNYLDPDDDADGVPTKNELAKDGSPMDTDKDGDANYLDTDDDDDGVLTRMELSKSGAFLDTDGDHEPNHLDVDDDGDGIATAQELADENHDGIPDYLEPPKSGTLAGGALCSVERVGGRGAGAGSRLIFALGLLLAARSWRRRQRQRSVLARVAWLASALVLGLGLVPRAQAQVAVDQFKPAPLASDGFALSRPDVLKPGSWGMMLMLDYANDPLVYEATPGDPSSEERVIAHHLVGHIGAALGIWNRFTAFAMLPVHLVMTGDDKLTVPAPAPEGAGIGDLAFGGRYLLLGTGSSRAALALELIARLPTAELANGSEAYSGDTIGSYEPAVVGEYRAGPFDVRARLGARLRKPTNVGNLRLDQEFLYGLGARYRLAGALYAHAEVYGSTFFASAFDRVHSPLEALLGAKYQPGDFNLGVAAGPGLLRGYGSPDVRIVATFGYAPVEKHERPLDRDHDGLLDADDACPRDPEDVDHFQDSDGCPEPDNDLDTILDVNDQCVNVAEDKDGFADADGCPDPDNDEDGLKDADDMCPNDPEDTDDFEDSDGCPDPDNDKDHILDGDDECPNQAEDFDAFEDENGCPEEGSGKVKLTCAKIDIQDKVYFDVASDRIQERSYTLLDQVASVLRAASYIKMLRIEGHTDARGNDAKNLDLSKRRAASVVRYLVGKDIAQERLLSEGYGETKPIASNANEAGRTENRRVEFVIVEQDSACGAAAPK